MEDKYMKTLNFTGGIMNKLIKALFIVGLVLSLSSAAMAYTGTYTPGVGINGTPHDLGTPGAHGMSYGASPADPLTRICIYCHAPHNTYRLFNVAIGAGPNVPDPAFDYLPLWNHTLQTDLSYIPYENGPGAPLTGPKASQAILDAGMTIGNVSLLCLSCHDGSVAVNSYGNSDQPPTSQSTGNATISTSYIVGQDKYLGNHHPIGFDYDTVFAGDPEIRDPDTAQMNPGVFIRDRLFGGTLQCASCHSVHNKGNSGEMLLWRSDQNSELCLTCHDKGIYTAP